MDFVCKIVVIDGKQKSLKRPRLESARIEIGSVKKCLFGKPDPEDTQKMLEEQIEADRERLFDRFGFVAEDLENNEKCDRENVENNKQNKGNRGILGRKWEKAKRKVLQSRNQSFITDFFKNRKNVQCLLEKKKEDNDSTS